MEIQDMLSTYDIKQFVLADAKSASRLVAHILNQVSRPTALTDAMLLIDVYSDLLLCDCAAVQICCRNMIQYLQRMDIKRSLAGVAMTMEAFAENNVYQLLQKDSGKMRMAALSPSTRGYAILLSPSALRRTVLSWQAARFSRELFSRRLNTRIDPWNSAASVSAQPDNLDPAEALKKVAISLSFTR
ncbi:hypothetical protein KXD40_006638 [Peronospora effusa]|nr:hypothetical protein KXD40_006638 [Peronospora effusa]